MARWLPDFDWHAAVQRAERILAAPPVKPFIRRPSELLPTLVFRAALPADVCLEANKTSRRAFAAAPHLHAAVKEKLWKHLSEQALPWSKYRWAWPLNLSGRLPQVLAVKFSSHANDAGSNPGKAAIDMLTCRKLLDREKQRYTEHRLGLLRDDRRSVVEQLHWWEFMPKRWPAFVLVEVRI